MIFCYLFFCYSFVAKVQCYFVWWGVSRATRDGSDSELRPLWRPRGLLLGVRERTALPVQLRQSDPPASENEVKVSVLVQVDRDGIGRPPHWGEEQVVPGRRERAVAQPLRVPSSS